MSEISPEEWLAGMQAASDRSATGALGVRVVAMDAETVELHMPISDASRQPFGLLHGGISLFLAESAASMHACWGVDLTQVAPVGLEINGSHLRSAREGTVRVVGRVLRRTSSHIFHQVDLFHLESGQPLCTARVTNYYKPLTRE